MQQNRALNLCLYKTELLVLLEKLRRRDIAIIMARKVVARWYIYLLFRDYDIICTGKAMCVHIPYSPFAFLQPPFRHHVSYNLEVPRWLLKRSPSHFAFLQLPSRHHISYHLEMDLTFLPSSSSQQERGSSQQERGFPRHLSCLLTPHHV